MEAFPGPGFNANCKDLRGIRFGRLVAVSPTKQKGRGLRWACECDCGNITAVAQGNLHTGCIRSCGCLKREAVEKRFWKHGEAAGHKRTDRFNLWVMAKTRARIKGIDFSISLEDIHVPLNCPILGIKLERLSTGRRGPGDNSPSLDRIDPKIGYTPENVWVISHRANRIKSDATVEELIRVCESVSKMINLREFS